MNFKTFEDLSKTVSNNLYKIPSDVDLVVGIPKSGIMVASMIALHLNLPLTDLDSLESGKIFSSGSTKQRKDWIKDPKEARKILIVDDSACSGNTFREAKEKLKKYKYKNKLIYLVVYVTDNSKDLPDIYFENCDLPRMFEWNYMHHALLEKSCVDIDGVLCQDPTEEENDDGEKYIKFISTVKPRVVPTRKIKYLVTTRLEKYRKYTEKWLKKNNIQYEQLIMMDLPSKAERVKLGNHGKFKGEQYKRLEDAILFIESNERQAPVIADVSGKDVFCVDNGKFYKPVIVEQPSIVQPIEPQIQKERKARKIFRKIVPLKVRKGLKKLYKRK